MKFTNFELIKYDDKHNIVFLRDLDQGGMTITNNAEAVFQHIQSYWGAVRLVYQDTQGEWAEIVWDPQIEFTARFRPWHGLVWDTLKN